MSAPPTAPELRVVVTARKRGADRLDEPAGEGLVDPAIAELTEQVRAAAPSDRLWLVGGEPTLRADLPALMRALRPLAPGGIGLESDGLVLGDERSLGPLREAGLVAVRVALHAPRTEAHDWLVGQRGAARRALKGLRVCTAAGLETEVVTTVTRPAMTQLAELVVLVRRLGAGVLLLRLLRERGAAAAAFRMLAPRLPLLERQLEEAEREARRRGLRLLLEGMSPCAAGSMARLIAQAPQWICGSDTAWQTYGAARQDPSLVAGPCARCPGQPACAGAPADYLAHFGWSELAAPAREPAEIVQARFQAPARVACPTCGDRGDGGSAAAEPSRAIRQRLVRAAGAGRSLRIASAASLAHPDAAALLADAGLLSFARIEVAGEGSALDEMSDAELRALRTLSRLDVALYGPDAERHDAHMGRAGAFEASLRGLARLARIAKIEVGAFAVLHDATEVSAYADAWELGALPGEPAFRLSAEGGCLADLAAATRALSVGRARAALEALLPPCLLGGDAPASTAADEAAGSVPSGSDRHGLFRRCVCDSSSPCPGLAAGWSVTPGGEPPS